MTVVAIDGPAGAGKSTVARRVAAELGLTYLDTGAMYRAVALAARRAGISEADGRALGRLASGLALSLEGDRVLLDEEDVSRSVRAPEIDKIVSRISAFPEVRRAMTEKQRAAAARGGVVIEGRDIGSVVIPDAPVKIYLTASLEERASRRWSQERGRGDRDRTVEEVAAGIAERDRDDMGRSDSPLLRAEGARVVDTTGRTIDEVVREIVELAGGQP